MVHFLVFGLYCRQNVSSANSPVVELSCRRTVLSANCIVSELSWRRTVLSLNCLVGELSCQWTVRSAKCLIGELSCRWTVLSVNCPVGKLSAGELSVGELFVFKVTLYSRCPRRVTPKQNFPRFQTVRKYVWCYITTKQNCTILLVFISPTHPTTLRTQFNSCK